MEDLLKCQIHLNCRLALPEGLQELMYDISREVLRAQPKDILGFIADYLSAVLVARENLTVASKVCTDVCENRCFPELKDELRALGLGIQDANDATTVVVEYFQSGKANEGNLLMKLLKKTDINKEQLPAVQDAVRRAFLRHQAHHTPICQSSSDSEVDEVTRAARHTLKLYKKSKPTIAEYTQAAVKIQAAYRAYDVRRKLGKERTLEKEFKKNIRFENVFPEDLCRRLECRTVPPSCFDKTDSCTTLVGSLMVRPSLQLCSMPNPGPVDVMETERSSYYYHEEERPKLFYVPKKEKEGIVHTLDALESRKTLISFQDNPQEIIGYAFDTGVKVTGINEESKDSDVGLDNSSEVDLEIDEGKDPERRKSFVSTKDSLNKISSFLEALSNVNDELKDSKQTEHELNTYMTADAVKTIPRDSKVGINNKIQEVVTKNSIELKFSLNKTNTVQKGNGTKTSVQSLKAKVYKDHNKVGSSETNNMKQHGSRAENNEGRQNNVHDSLIETEVNETNLDVTEIAVERKDSEDVFLYYERISSGHSSGHESDEEES